MWPFKKKRKPAESIEKKDIPLEKTYAQWKQEYSALEIENTEAEDLCAKEGDDWLVMLNKTSEIKKKMAVGNSRSLLLHTIKSGKAKKWNLKISSPPQLQRKLLIPMEKDIMPPKQQKPI